MMLLTPLFDSLRRFRLIFAALPPIAAATLRFHAVFFAA